MKNIRYFAQKYIDWVIKLGRVKFSLLGFIFLAALALCTHIFLSFLILGEIHWDVILYSITFGLLSAPFVIYFFTLLVEKLELSRLSLSKSVTKLRQEIQERILAEQRLAQANQDKTKLMATISHELRTPLNGIVGLSRMLLDTNLTAEQRNYLNTISFSAVSLGHIFNDIIDLDKIDANRIELYRQEINFHDLINDIANIGQFMAKQKNLDFVLKCSENLPHFLLLDGIRLSQILWNLLSNATKFTDKGQITVDIQRFEQNTYQFSVTDSGTGIPAEDIENIFTMYYQVEKNQHKAAGSGIGLAISKTIAKLMQGDLTVSSQLGQGATFVLTIRADEIAKPLPNDQMQPVVSNVKILLVEDIELNVVVARAVLEKLGCQVDVAMNGHQAIELFEKNLYDLVLLDIQLPDMTGFAIAQYFRQNYENGIYDYLPPLVALTANVMQSKAEYEAQGMDDVLRKPLDVKELTHCLQQYFSEEFNFSVPKMNKSAVNFSAVFEKSTADLIDYQFVRDLVNLIGVDAYLENIATFRAALATDDLNLQQAYTHYLLHPQHKAEFTLMAHKVKGAAGSLGLVKLQTLANLMQQGDLPDWYSNLERWGADFSHYQQESCETLESWLIQFRDYLAQK
ncbi:two-component system aerobic respiration control sensor histidine kinase ArcB [Pasteurella langaaensis DSM 22999]|uniref:Aerobic respiration control sensor protein n=1 Tax=Alitibacter langaaensis DSM 22999 TaxID=1122935 RepID=A0A2U0SKX1_9PAST|nr:ATP-binding protein [Pasteurella langaaensis]PVX31988.1 two-component system aerobic respiration control sensor histidine kinase ArcB [Pasteurella langaaensis DSM 22999]